MRGDLDIEAIFVSLSRIRRRFLVILEKITILIMVEDILLMKLNLDKTLYTQLPKT